eukprot:COSAG05_NODE_97_length_19444_cov_8.577174_14_plen_326_part_00
MSDEIATVQPGAEAAPDAPLFILEKEDNSLHSETKKQKKKREKKEKKKGETRKKGQNSSTNPMDDDDEGTVEFSNPMSETFEAEDTDNQAVFEALTLADEDSSKASAAAKDVRDEPPTPRSPNAPECDVDDDQHHDLDAEKREGRARLKFLLFMVVSAALVPFFMAIACFTLWIYYLGPNALSLMCAVVGCSMLLVLVLGIKGALKTNHKRLQMFSFLLLLVLSMQISMIMVVLLDDGSLANAYLASAGRAINGMCDITHLPVGAGMLPVQEICDCVKKGSYEIEESNVNASGSWVEAIIPPPERQRGGGVHKGRDEEKLLWRVR